MVKMDEFSGENCAESQMHRKMTVFQFPGIVLRMANAISQHLIHIFRNSNQINYLQEMNRTENVAQ